MLRTFQMTVVKPSCKFRNLQYVLEWKLEHVAFMLSIDQKYILTKDLFVHYTLFVRECFVEKPKVKKM